MNQIGTMKETGRPDLSQQTQSEEAGTVFLSSSSPEYRNLPNTPAPVPCEFCGALRYHRGISLLGVIMWIPAAEPCTCPEAIAAAAAAEAERLAREEAERRAEEDSRHRERIRRIVGECGMGERFRRRTFATFQEEPENRRALATAKRYVDGFDKLLPRPNEPEPGRNGLFISGPPGTGKTHLAASIANALIEQGRPVVCMTSIDLLERIKRTYSKGSVDESSVLTLYKTCPLLIVDDLGKELLSEWSLATLYNIINGRYEAYLPIIITTNYSSDELTARLTPKDTKDATTARATIDRLMEMCSGVSLGGASWRRKK